MGIIYKIKNKINNKIYIGKSVFNTTEKRWKEHIRDSYDISSPSYKYTIHKAIRKYGIENFVTEIVENGPDNKLNELEQKWIKYYDSFYNGYNETLGGEGALKYDREIIFSYWENGLSSYSIAKKLNANRNTIINILKSNNLYNSLENDKRYKKEFVYKKVYQYGKDGKFIKEYDSITQAAKEIKVDTSFLNKVVHGIKPSAKGYYWSLELLDIYPIPKNKLGQKIKCINTGEIFDSIQEAAEHYNLNPCSFSNYFSGRTKSVGKHPVTKEKLQWEKINEMADKLATSAKPETWIEKLDIPTKKGKPYGL